MVATQKNFIELDRRFRNITEKELENPELLAAFGEHLYDSKTDSWAKLLESRRVVLLAEAGSGKTEEMKAQRTRLCQDGKYSFYADLSSLAQNSLHDPLSADEESKFNAWKTAQDAPAWFFLDSVDELKLTQGKLKLALNRFSKDITGQITRAHVIISCRPSDWKFDLDLKAVQETLSAPPAAANSAGLTGEELFLAAFSRDKGTQQEQDKSADKPNEVRTVIMLPLTRRQIETYARSCGVRDAAAFMKEIHRQEAWPFANRPLDCGNLVQIWNAKGRLGTRVEQHEANITAKLNDDPERPDNNLLTPEDAREGAERLALALALTRTRTILAPGHEAAEGVLDPAAILTDWTDAKRNALLRRGLFDPATYGRIRFHHRSAEEYLAARCLKRLREKGMPINALKSFFFAEKYGAKVVIPSMRPVAAWLALWNDEIRWELIKREPEVPLAYGDPGSLSPEARAEVLRGFAAAYGDGGWRGVDTPSIGEVRRLACPELAPVIRELWEKHSASEEVTYLLLRLIWQGAIRDCVDIAEEVAFDTQRPDYQRSIAVSGLVACESSGVLRKIAESILAEQEKWSNEIVPSLAKQLFPAALSVQELIILIERTPKPRSVTSGFSWYLERIAEEIDPSSGASVDLRDAIADLIWKSRNPKEDYESFMSRFSYLSSGLACLCHKQLLLVKEEINQNLVRSCVIANFFKRDPNMMDYTGIEKHLDPVREFFKANFREKAFWIETAFMEFSQVVQDGYFRVNRVLGNSILGGLVETDKSWLLETVDDTALPLLHRDLALESLIQFWHKDGERQNEAECLRKAVSDHYELTEKINKYTKPLSPNPEAERMNRYERRMKCIRKGREQQRIDNWKKRRKEIVDEPDVAFSLQQLPATVENIAEWLGCFHELTSKAENKGISKFSNLQIIEKAFAQETVSRLIEAFWNNPPEESSDANRVCRYQLCHITEEKTAKKWVEALNSETAKNAARYAVDCLYGFSYWFIELAKAHPDVVLCVLGDKLEHELATVSSGSFSDIMYYLPHADMFIKQLLSPRLRVILLKWDSIHGEGNAHWSIEHLNRIVGILDETVGVEERAGLGTKCTEQFSRNPNGPLALPWLRGVFRFDPEQAAEVLEQGLNAVEECERANLAVRLFAGLFKNDLSSVLPCLSAIEEQRVKINVLKRLVILSYTFIHHEQDNVHDGVYTPDVRDDAASARGSLLSALLDTSGAEAHKIILELADDPLFADSPEWLRFRAREQAAKDAEFAPKDPADLVTLEKKFEAPPRNRDELFAVMMDRLDDIQHYIAHHKFTIRQTLRCIKRETEMQRYLAGKLHDKANGAYAAVEREPEDADRKKPDIRLSAVQGSQQAAIEVKLAENWSINDFLRALSNQLVGQYLRHQDCKAGCLLLTCNGSKSYWEHPETKEQVYFPELIKLLQTEAKAIEQEKNHEIRLAVFGLDLTDPPLKPTHA